MLVGLVRGMNIEGGDTVALLHTMTKRSSLRYFRASPEIIGLAVMLYPPSGRSHKCSERRLLAHRNDSLLRRARPHLEVKQSLGESER